MFHPMAHSGLCTVPPIHRVLINSRWVMLSIVCYLQFTPTSFLDTAKNAAMFAWYAAMITKPKSHQLAANSRHDIDRGDGPAPPWGVSDMKQNQSDSLHVNTRTDGSGWRPTRSRFCARIERHKLTTKLFGMTILPSLYCELNKDWTYRRKP